MAKKIHKRIFTVGGIVKLWSNANVNASSLEEALELSKTLTIEDFIQSNDCNDSQFKIVQVFDPDFDVDI